MRCWPAILIPFFALLARSEELAEQLTAKGIAEFTAAYQAWDGARFGMAAEMFRLASTNTPASATPLYWLGTAKFHQMLQLRSQPTSPANTQSAEAAMDAALAALNRAVKLDPRHAESHALLGTVYGMKITGPWRAVRFGPRVEKHRQQAMTFGAENPRVRYLLGVCQFHTATKPPAWREALDTLLAAEKLFTAEAQVRRGPLEPCWGRSSCLTFIGETFERLGERAQAANYFRRALELQPTNHLAREGLARLN